MNVIMRREKKYHVESQLNFFFKDTHFDKNIYFRSNIPT